MEIGGVSVVLTVTPTLPQTLTPTLHPRYSGHRKRIRFDALTRIPKVGTFAYSF